MNVGIFDLLDSIPVPIFLKDTAGVYRECNAAFARFIGLPKQEILGKPSAAIAPPELADIYRQMDGILFQHSDVPQVYESSVLHSDGTNHAVIFFRAPLKDQSGAVTGLVGVMYDITADKQKEARLRKSEQRHRALVEQSSEGIITFDPETGKIEEANRQFCAMIGYTVEELLQMTIFEFAEEEKECIETNIRKATESTYALVGLQKYRRKDGSSLIVEVSLACVQVENEKFIMASVRDVTAYKQIEAEIRRQELFLRTMTQSSPLAYFVVDNYTDKIIYYNANFCDIWRVENLEDELGEGGLRYGDVISRCLPLVSDAENYIESCTRLRDVNNRVVVEEEIKLVDGRIIRRFSKQIRDAMDKYYGRLYIYEDVTQRKQMEQVLRQSEEIYRQLFLNSPAIKIVVDPETAAILDVNQAAIDYYGYSADEIRGMSIYDITISGPAIVLNHMQSVRDAYGDYYQSTHRLKNGETREVEVFSGLTNIGGRKLITSIVVDITARRHAEKMLHSVYELRRRSDFINNIIKKNTVVDEKVASELKLLGIDCMAPLVCCLISFDETAEVKDDFSNSDHDVHMLQNGIIELLHKEQGCLAWECRGNIGVLCQTIDKDISAIANYLKNNIERYNNILTVKIGVGGKYAGSESIAKSYREAWGALISGKCKEVGEQNIIYYSDLGAFQLLTDLGGKESAREYVQNKIGKLIKYDCERGTNYLYTLEEILKSNNMKEAADKMYLHPKTLTFRKQRIKKILGAEIDHFETKIALAIAIKLHKLTQIIGE